MKRKISEFIESNIKKIIYGSLILNGLLIAVLIFGNKTSSVVIDDMALASDNNAALIENIPSIPQLLIEVVGEVNNPGIYKISRPIMVLEAIDLAGGLTKNANMDYVHQVLLLSKTVSNNEKIYIPSIAQQVSGSSDSSNTSLININSASLSELDELPGVGPVTAQKIIDGRPYTSVEDLQSLDGISDTLYNNIVTLVTV